MAYICGTDERIRIYIRRGQRWLEKKRRWCRKRYAGRYRNKSGKGHWTRWRPGSACASFIWIRRRDFSLTGKATRCTACHAIRTEKELATPSCRSIIGKTWTSSARWGRTVFVWHITSTTSISLTCVMSGGWSCGRKFPLYPNIWRKAWRTRCHRWRN